MKAGLTDYGAVMVARMRALRATPLVSVCLVAACAGSAIGVPRAGSASRPVGGGVVVATGHGWTSTGLDGRIPRAGSCHLRAAADGEPLPDPACTPGAVDAAVTDRNTATTVCRRGGYTSSVRPPESLTEPVKRKLLAAYGIPAKRIGDYELDHLVELASGGASDVRNLWPEPDKFQQFHRGSYVRNDKDVVEAYTFHAICDGKVSVTAVQRAMASDWTTAVRTLGLPPIPGDYRG